MKAGLTQRAALTRAELGASLAPAYAAYVLLGLIWGANFIFVKWAGVLITPRQIVLLRVICGFLPLLLAGLLSGALSLRHWRHAHHFLVMSILATAFYYVAFAKGTVLLLSSVAGMLSGAIPLFAFLVALVFLREEPVNRCSLGGTLIGFLGILLIAHPWRTALGSVSLPGVGWMAVGSLSLGASFVYARKFISPLGLSPLALTTYQIGIALCLLLATTRIAGIGAIFAAPRAALGLTIGLGVLGTGLAYILYYAIVGRLGAVTASSVTYLPPIVALFIGGVLVGDPVTWLDILAMAAILLGVGLVQIGRTAGRRAVGR